MTTTPRSTLATFLSASLLATLPLAAQTAKPSATHATASHAATHTVPAAHDAGGGCIVLPELSPKIPALPAGSPCAKALYTVSVEPGAKVTYASPMAAGIAAELGLESSSFTLAYIDTKAGTAPAAQSGKYLTVKYTGYLADGSKFDSSEDHPGKEPLSFQLGGHQVVTGWDTGFAGMKVGGKRRLFIPYQLAYGPNGRPPTIPAKSELIFDMELVGVSDTPPAPKEAPAAAAPATPPSAPAAPAAGSAPKPQ